MKYFKYDVRYKLINVNYIHDSGLFVGNSHEPLVENLNFLRDILI